MAPLAHHTSKPALLPLLLLGGAWVPVFLTIGRARLTAVRAKLTGPRRRS